ncbi:class I glutamine amidotransferase-like protein [Mycena pura]|uniref:D-lactate dehydratase n=1 Tax=Mycena pura TaxID=153505 RepID=A0AAD6Y210_9AGAR|nr:class I glutamine amidotransferase-like protein [Mycena pura]
MPSAIILIADGTEEMEFTITYDTLVRAGVACQSAYVRNAAEDSTAPRPYAHGSRGIRIMYDAVFEAPQFLPPASGYDALVIPGGAKGAETMSSSAAVQELVREFLAQGKIVGMICAGSLTALTSKLPRQPLTSHPSVKAQLEKIEQNSPLHFDYSEDPVVISSKLVTRHSNLNPSRHSRGPVSLFIAGTAFPFALTLVEMLCGAEKRAEVRAPMVFPAATPF